jgi:uncharacterized protein YjbJ (UPF0337 family)
MILHGVGEATGNSTMKNIGAAALMGSGFMTALGYGKDYATDYGAGTSPR